MYKLKFHLVKIIFHRMPFHLSIRHFLQLWHIRESKFGGVQKPFLESCQNMKIKYCCAQPYLDQGLRPGFELTGVRLSRTTKIVPRQPNINYRLSTGQPHKNVYFLENQTSQRRKANKKLRKQQFQETSQYYQKNKNIALLHKMAKNL